MSNLQVIGSQAVGAPIAYLTKALRLGQVSTDSASPVQGRAELIQMGLLRPATRYPRSPALFLHIDSYSRADRPADSAAKVASSPSRSPRLSDSELERQKKRKRVQRKESPKGMKRLPVGNPRRCEACGYPKLTANHEKYYCSKRDKQGPIEIAVVADPLPTISQVLYDLYFDPFPVAATGLRDAFRILNGLKQTKKFFDKYADESRKQRIGKLNPVITHLGKKHWKGYAVYEFGERFKGRVVLESVIAPNATYILSSRWRIIISLSKVDVREVFKGEWRRVIHQENWHERVIEALGAYQL